MKQIILLISLFTTFFTVAQDCNHVFLGEVSDYHDKTPIIGATVYIKNLDKYTTSDADGKFKIKNLCKGQLTLVISHISCETKTVSYDITGDTFKPIALEHHIEELGEVSVKADATKRETSTAQEATIDSKTLRRYNNLSIGDALEEISGVSSIKTGNSIVKPVINGLHSSRILIMNNGVRLQDQEWGVEHAPNIDINAANQLTVIKGSGALRYGGDAIGGVVVVKPSRIIVKDTLYGRTIFGGQTNGRGYNIASNLNKNYSSGWFGHVQGSYRRSGDFQAPDYILSNTGLESLGISTRFGKKTFESGFEMYYSFLNNEIGILRAAHIGNLLDFERAINAGRPLRIEDFTYDINVPKQGVTHHLAKVNYYKRFQNFGKVSLQYDYQNNRRQEFDVRVGERRNIPAVDLILQTHSILADVNLDSNLDRKYNLGLLGRYQNNFADPDTGVRRIIPDYDKYDFGVYATTEWLIDDDLIVDAGIRYDFNRIDAKKFYRTSRWLDSGYDIDFNDIIVGSVLSGEVQEGTIDFSLPELLANPIFNYHNFSASIGGKYSIDDNNKVMLNFSHASRPPNASELFSDGLHHALARFEIGDIRFNKEIANRISASYNYTNSKFNFLAEVFYNRVNDYIFLRPDNSDLSTRGYFAVWIYEQTNAELFGIDINATYDVTPNFQYQHKSAFIKGNDLKTDLPLIDIPPFNTTNQIRYYNEKWNNFSASLKSEWVFEQNEFPDFNYQVTNQLTGEEFTIDISSPPPAYHLLHFYSDATFNFKGKTSLNVAFGVNNIFNASYRNYLNGLRFFADDIGRNFTLQLQLNY
ncbi:TonB-dependent receptor [Winogradskyella haliclonae]|uniref:TonB-dependent receptor n=1 Tax=Winogradskyella haliclonae TaxID=2048558 RepID=A0ABQ2BZ57_9FLAO|nr:TonB-dependent receptor [Winogradskyella haliclonae]GGI57384.1 TonB-dependent receptor [Winogradskyella haliclonae]